MHSAKLTLLLFIGILLSAMGVVYTSFQARASFITWQALIEKSYRLDVEWGQLIIEKHTLASYSRLQGIAVHKLGMVEPQGKRIEIIRRKL